MTTLSLVADLALNAMIVGIAGYLVYLVARHLWSAHDQPTPAVDDPVDPAYWDLLAETRRILESE